MVVMPVGVQNGLDLEALVPDEFVDPGVLDAGIDQDRLARRPAEKDIPVLVKRRTEGILALEGQGETDDAQIVLRAGA